VAEVNFLVLAEARSGSTNFIHRLNTHPDIECFLEGECSEILHPRLDHQLPPLDVLTDYFSSDDVKCRGAKILLKQMPDNLLQYARSQGIKIILLTRRDRVSRIVSSLYAYRTNVYHRKNPTDKFHPTKGSGITDELISNTIDIVKKDMEKIKVIRGLPGVLNIDYSETYQPNLGNILNFLGVRNLSLPNKLYKNEPYHKIIRGYRGLVARVKHALSLAEIEYEL